MITFQSQFQKRNGFSFLMMLLLACACTLAYSQATPTIFMLSTFQKVAPENVAAYEKLMADHWKPLHQLRKQNGKILNWALYKVHYKGANDDFNYAAVSYYESFIKTEPNDNWAELMKAANPKGDAAAIIAKTQSVRTIVSQSVYSRAEGVASKTPTPIKYGLVSFQKSKPGMHAEALKMEAEEWKAAHQAMVDAGQMVAWNVWNLVIPNGAEINHNYFTSNLFSSYDQMAQQDYAGAFKKVGKDSQQALDRADKAKDMVRRELLEFVMGTN
jgi:hypothetical protein